MDYSEPKSKREKKSDKSRKNFEKNGCFSQKHIRLSEALASKQKPAKKP